MDFLYFPLAFAPISPSCTTAPFLLLFKPYGLFSSLSFGYASVLPSPFSGDSKTVFFASTHCHQRFVFPDRDDLPFPFCCVPFFGPLYLVLPFAFPFLPFRARSGLPPPTRKRWDFKTILCSRRILSMMVACPPPPSPSPLNSEEMPVMSFSADTPLELLFPGRFHVCFFSCSTRRSRFASPV